MRTKSTAILPLIGFALSTAALCLPAISGYIPGQRVSCELTFRVFNLLEVSPWAWGMALLPLWLLALTFLRPPKAAAGIVTAALCACACAALFCGAVATKEYLTRAGGENIRLCFGLAVMPALLLAIAATALARSRRKA